MTVPYNFVELKPIVKHAMPTMLESYDWLEANKKPVEATPIELGYKIDQLERDLAFEKESLRKVKHEYQTYMDDYKRLDTDYLNSQGEVKKLKAQLEFHDGLEQYNLWLMQQYLNLKNKSVEEKKEVDKKWF